VRARRRPEPFAEIEIICERVPQAFRELLCLLEDPRDLVAATAARAEIKDRIAAVVNGSPITLSVFV